VKFPISVRGLLFAVALVILVGCGGQDHPRCFPVRGQVLAGDRPLAEATVLLHPLFESAPVIPRPIARTDADGRFEISTFGTHDGAPPGEYAITVELRENRTVGEEVIRDGRNLLPSRYSDARQSDLRCEVVAGNNDIPPLQLPNVP